MRSVRKSMAILFAGILLAALLVLPQMLDKNLLFAGAESYIFYTGSQSSNAQMTLAEGENAARVKFFLSGVTGESARYESAEDAFAQAEKYGAKFLFSERAAEVTNYYYYSPSTCTSRCGERGRAWAARSSSEGIKIADVAKIFAAAGIKPKYRSKIKLSNLGGVL